MKSVAMITEYNPFHHGHLYHAQQSKQRAKADVAIAIMSGQFMMRGMPAMFNKFTRAQMALQGVDLVVELPLVGSLSSSDLFAEMGIKVADYLNATTLSFGSESGNLQALKEAAEQIITLEHSPSFNDAIKSGKSYARIIAENLDNAILDSPNNILAISYLKALMRQQSTIQPMTISRQHTHHHENVIQHARFASGSAIRKSIEEDQSLWKSMVPENNIPLMTRPFSDQQRLFDFIKFATLQHSPTALKQIYTITEGFENRLHRAVSIATDYPSLMRELKTKRYTYTHIQRILMNVLLHFQVQDASTELHAVRILAMTSAGQRYLKHLKKTEPNRHFITNVNRKTATWFTQEIKATGIYNSLTGQQQNDFNTPVYMSKTISSQL